MTCYGELTGANFVRNLITILVTDKICLPFKINVYIASYSLWPREIKNNACQDVLISYLSYIDIIRTNIL